MAGLDLKDLKLVENGLDDLGDAFDDAGGKASEASKAVEEFEKRIYALILKANPLPRLVKDVNDQLLRQADQMRQTLKVSDELAKAYERLARSQGGLKQGPKFGSAAKPAEGKSPLEPLERSAPPISSRERPKTSAAGGLTNSESEALGGSTIDAIAALAKGDEPMKVMIDLGKDVAKMFQKASIEGVSLGVELKRLGVSAGLLKVVGAEAGAARAGLSSLAAGAGEAASATGLLGEAAAAGAAEMIAFTPLGLAIGGVALAAAGVGAAFAITAQQIGKSTGENLDHLHLTEEQLARVKDKGVTMGDVMSGVWKTAADMLREAFGPTLNWLGDLFGKTYQGVVDGVLRLVKACIQGVGAFLGGFKAIFGAVGPAVGDLVISGLNIAAAAIEGLINRAIDAINRLVRKGNSAAEAVGLSIRLPELDHVSIKSLDNPFEGKAAAWGKDIAKGIASGAEDAGRAWDALGDRIVKNIVKARDNRALKDAGEAVKKAADDACNCGPNVENVTNSRSAFANNAVQKTAGNARNFSDVREAQTTSVDDYGPSLEAVKPIVVSEALDSSLAAASKALEAVLTPLDAMVDKMSDINALAPELGKQFEAAFGQTGKALGGVLSSFTAYSLQIAKLKKEAAGADLSPEQQEQRTRAQIKAYGAMASAAKGFFKEGSDGYKAMQVAEIAFHTIETLNTIKSMALETVSAAHTAGTQAAKQGAYGATAYAHALADMPFPFNLLAGATIIAALVQAGAAIKGKGGGGASAPGVNDMKNRQESQATGSVLGDVKAKSESLDKALGYAEAYQNKDLEYGNAMVRSLRSIDGQIGAVAAALARSFGAGGMLSTEGLNLGKTGSSASLSNAGFSKSTTRTLQDQGIQFNAASLSDIAAGNLSGSTYQQMLETTKKKAFFLTTSNKSQVITETGALGADFVDQITKLITSLSKGVTDAAGAIKATEVEGILAKFQVDLGKLSFKDMSGTQIEEALNAIFGTLGDNMAKAAVPAIAQFQKVGEGAFEALVRVARQYEVIDTALKSIGKTFGDVTDPKNVGVASLGARENLVKAFGGLDNLTDQTSFFGEHFLADEERLKPVRASVVARLAELKQPIDLSRDGFKALVLKQDVSTTEGAALYAQLLALAPAFDKVAAAAENAASAADDRRRSIQDDIDQFEKSPSELLAASRDKERKAAEALDASLPPLLKKLYDLQDAAKVDEKRNSIQDQIDQFTKSQSELLAVSRKKEKEEAILLNSSLGDLLDTLYALQDAAKVDEKRTSIQDQIDQFTKSPSELLAASRAKEREEAVRLDSSLGKLLDTLYALQDAAKVDEKRTSIQDRIDGLTLTPEQQLAKTRAKERAEAIALDPALGALIDSLFDLEDAAKAAELATKRAALQNQILRAIGTPDAIKQATANERADTLKDLDPSLRSYQKALWDIEDATNAVTDAQQAHDKAMSDASTVYGRVTSEIQANVDKFKGFADSLKAFRKSLDVGGPAMNDPLIQYARTKSDFERVAGLASQGNVDALGELQGVSEAYLEASKAAQADNIGYFRDLAAVKSATEAAQDYADQQVDQGKAQLKALEDQFTALGVINTSVMSVETAVSNLTSAINVLAKANEAKKVADQAGKDLVNPPAVKDPKAGQVPIGANDDFQLAAAKVLYNATKGGVDRALFSKYFANDPFGKSVKYNGDPEELRQRYGFATGGSFTVGGAGGPDSQFMPLHLTPGEMVNVSRPDTLGALVDEIRGLRADNAALRQEVADLKTAATQTAINTGRQVRLSERWDGDGLPQERTAA